MFGGRDRSWKIRQTFVHRKPAEGLVPESLIFQVSLAEAITVSMYLVLSMSLICHDSSTKLWKTSIFHKGKKCRCDTEKDRFNKWLRCDRITIH